MVALCYSVASVVCLSVCVTAMHFVQTLTDSVSVCTKCIAVKRCVLEQTLLTAYISMVEERSKSYRRNRLVPKWM